MNDFNFTAHNSLSASKPCSCDNSPPLEAEQKREAEALISAESLNTDEARRYITTSLRREYASDNGTELNAILPKMSPLNPQYLTKKQSVFQKIAVFVEKFKGVGGNI
jgi:type I restriction enzyme, R subunit